MANEDLHVRLKATGQSAFGRGMRKAASDVGSVGDRARRSAGGLRLFATATTSSARGLRLMAGGAFTGAAALTAMGAIGAKKAISVATDVAESSSKNTVLFGKYAKSVDQFSKTSASRLGISRRAALESAGTFGNLFAALDIGPKRSAKMSTSLTTLAADLASFNNATPEEALEAIQSGLVGETEPLRKFGVNLSDATLRQEALRQGLIKTTKQALTPQQKALAVNALLFKQTKKAQGDFGRTSRGLANQQRILKASVEDVAGSLGESMLPTATRAVRGLNRDVVPRVKEFSASIGKIFERKDVSVGEKMKLTGAEARKAFAPLTNEARTFWSKNREKIIAGAESAVSSAGARMADAAAAAAPHAASMFVKAFKGAGPWGQLLTVALVSKKLGVFSSLGNLAASRTCGSFGSKLPGCMQASLSGAAAGGKGGRWATVGRVLGLTVARLAWPVTVALLTKELVDHFKSTAPGLAAESGNPETTRGRHRVQPGDPSGADIWGKRHPDPGPATGGGLVPPAPGDPFARKGGPAARSAAVPTLGGRALIANLTIPVVVDNREIGRAQARLTADDLARM